MSALVRQSVVQVKKLRRSPDCGMRPSNMSEARLLAELSANDGASDPTGHAARPSNASDDSGDSGGASPGSTSKRGPPVPPPALNLVPPVMIPHDFPSVEEAIHVASAASLNPDHVREVWGAFTRTAVDVIEAFNSAKFSKVRLVLLSPDVCHIRSHLGWRLS